MAIADLKYSELTRKIIGCAMKVHRYFGSGFREKDYERALVVEFKRNGINYKQQLPRDIYYEGEWVCSKRLDLLVENIVLTELKARSFLSQDDCTKLINYLRVYGIEVGLILNFGTSSLQFKRFINSELQKFNNQ